MPATVALPELTVVREYLERDAAGNWVNNQRSLAAKHGVSTTPIRRILIEAGVIRAAAKTRKVAVSEATIVQDYLEKDRDGNWVNTCQTLAAKHGISKLFVRRLLKKAVVIRTGWETRKLRPLADGAREAYDQGKTPLEGRQALDCRMDAGWEARERIADVVYCRECLLPFSGLTKGEGKGHVWGAHRLTLEQYHMKWSGARMQPFAHQANSAKKRGGGRQSDLERIMAAFAAKYLDARQLSACRLDINWERKQEDPKIWREHLACRVCGFIGFQCLLAHLRARHKLNKAGYRQLYPKAPTSSIAALEQLSLRNENLAKAWRPDRFESWPLWQQKAGEYLLRNQRATAPEAARYLDVLKVPGPWGKSTAEQYARTKAGEVAFYRLRQKLGMPKSCQPNI